MLLDILTYWLICFAVIMTWQVKVKKDPPDGLTAFFMFVGSFFLPAMILYFICKEVVRKIK